MSKFPESWKDQIMSVVKYVKHSKNIEICIYVRIFVLYYSILLCHCYVALGDFRNQRAMSMLDSLQQSMSDLPTLHQYIHPLKIELRLSLGDIQMAEQVISVTRRERSCG